MDAKGAISYLSPSIERILGYPQDVVMNRRAFDFIHPEQQEDSIQLFNKRIQSTMIEPPSPSEIRLQHQDGSWRILEATSKNLLDYPAVRGLVVNARDITQRKAAEAALQRSHHQLEDRVAERTAELFKANAQLRQEIQEREQVSREKEERQDQLIQAQKMEAVGTLTGGLDWGWPPLTALFVITVVLSM